MHAYICVKVSLHISKYEWLLDVYFVYFFPPYEHNFYNYMSDTLT